MLGDKSVCIKALRWRGGIIEWNYDTPRQAAPFWKKLTETGRAPDTDELLMTANMFVGLTVEPVKCWQRRMQVAKEAAEILADAGRLA